MAKTSSPKVRIAHLQVCSQGKVAIPLSGKLEWLQVKATPSSCRRIDRILYRRDRDVQANISNGEITLFIR